MAQNDFNQASVQSARDSINQTRKALHRVESLVLSDSESVKAGYPGTLEDTANLVDQLLELLESWEKASLEDPT